jgi:hypothetical protein
MKKITAWLLMAVQWYLLYHSLWNDSHIAWNIFRFAMWLFTVLVVFMVGLKLFVIIAEIASGKSCEGKLDGKRTLPPGVGAVSDITIAFILAAFGHWTYAILAIVQCVGEAFIFTPITDEKELKENV